MENYQEPLRFCRAHFDVTKRRLTSAILFRAADLNHSITRVWGGNLKLKLLLSFTTKVFIEIQWTERFSMANKNEPFCFMSSA